LECPHSQVSVDPLYETKRIPSTQTNAEIICGGGEYLPFCEDVFDVVISHNVLDHTHNPNNVLDEISRVLEPNGQFFFSVNTFSIPTFIRKRLGLVDTPHPHHFSVEEVKQSLQYSGFNIEKQGTESHWFSDEKTLKLLSRKEFKKVAGKFAQIELFTATCSLK
jgi:SAM-dependent methyltransferase